MTSKKKEEKEILIKIVIIGDWGVGKTSIISRFFDNIFSDIYLTTIGIDYKVKTIVKGTERIRITMFDTAGQERYQILSKQYYQNSDGVLMTYDWTRKDSLEQMNKWFESLHQFAEDNVTKVLIANKSDAPNIEISKEESEKFALENKIKLFETSAKKNINISEAFDYWIEKILEIKKRNCEGDLVESIKLKKQKKQKKKNCCVGK